MDNNETKLAKEYINSVWAFLVEHSDLTKEGSYFIKFHTEGIKDFNKRVMARRRGYHRGDPRYKVYTPEDKQKLAQGIKKHALEKKESKVKEKPRTKKDRIRSVLIRIINRIFE